MGCVAKQEFNGVKVSCGSCDYCVGRRIGGWVNRAMMEKACFPHAFALTLTYSEDTVASRLGARTFIYRHIIDFNKRLRAAIEYKMDVKEAAYSFLVAGEMGDRKKRCHWHMVIFSQVDLCSIGKWIDHKGAVVDDAEGIITPIGAEGRNRSWSLWPHGFVVAQVPDYGGMRYALMYGLKDQFNIRNAEGTGRERSAEVFSVGMFRMSKKPAIGQRFVERYLAECAEREIVPPSRKLSIPEVKWPFFPTGRLADILLEGFAKINADYRAKYGADASGWSSLIYESRLSERDLELLGVYEGEEDEQETDRQVEAQILSGRSGDNAAWIAKRQAASDGEAARKRCFSSEACTLCLRGRGDAAFGVQWDGYGRPYRVGVSPETFRDCQRDGSRATRNGYCAVIGPEEMQAAS